MIFSFHFFHQLYLESHKRSHRNAATAAASRRKGVSTRSKSLVWWKHTYSVRIQKVYLQHKDSDTSSLSSSPTLTLLFFFLPLSCTEFLPVFVFSLLLYRLLLLHIHKPQRRAAVSKFENVCVCVCVCWLLIYEFPLCQERCVRVFVCASVCVEDRSLGQRWETTVILQPLIDHSARLPAVSYALPPADFSMYPSPH